jgi:phosphate transport system protein
MAVVNDHTVKAFDEDLNRLRGLISEMGGAPNRRCSRQ